MSDVSLPISFRAEVEALHEGFPTLTLGARRASATATAQCDVRSDIECARTLRRRAGFELVLDPGQSLRTLARARQLVGSMQAAEDRREQVVRETLARCHSLEAVAVDDVDAVAGSTAIAAPEGDGGLERQLLIPWLIAVGEAARARQWAEAAARRVAAEGTHSRRCLADLLDQARLAAEGRRPALRTLCDGDVRSATPSATPSAWIELQLSCYWHFVTGNVAYAQRARQWIDEFATQIPPAFGVQPAVCDAIFEALAGSRDVDLALPEHELALFNIGPVIVGAEAVALGGTSECAARWHGWFTAVWPAHVLRAPAFPVLVHRVRALLACRAGDAAAGLRLMDEAISVADRIDARVEAALARVQYAELLALDPRQDARERWLEVSQSGRERCHALGIPFEHHAHRARMAATLGRFDQVCVRPTAGDGVRGGRLTAREIEVLRLFSAGHSYRDAGETLGIGWRTVQSHAYNAYQKLGVSSKIAAIGAATRLGLL